MADDPRTVRISLEDAHRGTTLNLDVAHEDGSRTMAVTVPAGVSEGQKLRLRGKGGPGRHGGRDGDIYLHADLAIKERALARTAPTGTTPGRYRAPDALLAFLEAL